MLAACLLSLVGVVLHTANNSYLILLTASPEDFFGNNVMTLLLSCSD